MRIIRLVAVLALALSARSAPVTAQQAPQTESDAYTRYELLAPGSAKFRIIYEVTATTAGATHYYNPIRKGSVATDEHVSDRATGKPLAFDVVDGKVARADGVRGADTTGSYIRVTLARPVPGEGGEARVLIDKTYEDATSYKVVGQEIAFTRPLGIKRNAIVLPLGYELVASNYPSQILREADGRLKISFWNVTPAEAPVTLRARPAAALAAASTVTLPAGAQGRLDERAYQNREIVYFLQQPETHSFDLYHDYTEMRAGTSTYRNVVRGGSTVSRPSARNLDTGAPLKLDVIKGDTEVVVFHFAPVKSGESIRLRMSETYTDSARYKLVGDELYWDRSFGRPANAIVLPQGWALTNSAIPATVSELGDGRIRLDFLNPRADEIAVLITAHRR